MLFLSTGVAEAVALPQTVDEYKALLGTIPAMFVALLAGSLVYSLVQTRTATLNGKPMGFVEYWTYGREVIIGFIINVGAFIGLLLADQLTLMGAFTLGISGNALADYGKGGRTADLALPPAERGQG